MKVLDKFATHSGQQTPPCPTVLGETKHDNVQRTQARAKALIVIQGFALPGEEQLVERTTSTASIIICL